MEASDLIRSLSAVSQAAASAPLPSTRLWRNATNANARRMMGGHVRSLRRF